MDAIIPLGDGGRDAVLIELYIADKNITAKELETIVARHEMQQLELKESFGAEAIETACAFANAHGGFIVIGVDDNGLVSRPRNRLIAQTFYDMHIIEHYGSGMRRMKKDCDENGSPYPTMKSGNGEFRITFSARTKESVCKAEVYKPEQKWKKGITGQWEAYDAQGVEYAAFPLGHGEKSVIQLLRWGLEMTDDEIMAIRWHVSGFDLAFQSPENQANYGAATDKCPLLAVLRAADGLASHIMKT